MSSIIPPGLVPSIPLAGRGTDTTVGPLPLTGATTAHRVIVSIGVLLGAAFVFQGVADSGPQAHTLVLALLIGVVILLTMRANAAGDLAWLTTYPWVPPQGG